MKLTLEQAIKIRDDFKHLEGKTSKDDFIINKVVVGPHYSENLRDFIGYYYQNDYEYRDDEELLAKSFNPKSYCVYIFYYDESSVFLYENIFDMSEESRPNIKLEKYGLNPKV